MEIKSKALTFIGFAIKAGKLTRGQNSVEALRRAELLLICSSASDNAKDKAVSLSKKFGCPLICTKFPLEDAVHRENCKLAAIRDKNLAKAVLDNLDDKFSLTLEDSGEYGR